MIVKLGRSLYYCRSRLRLIFSMCFDAEILNVFVFHITAYNCVLSITPFKLNWLLCFRKRVEPRELLNPKSFILNNYKLFLFSSYFFQNLFKGFWNGMLQTKIFKKSCLNCTNGFFLFIYFRFNNAKWKSRRGSYWSLICSLKTQYIALLVMYLIFFFSCSLSLSFYYVSSSATLF